MKNSNEDDYTLLSPKTAGDPCPGYNSPSNLNSEMGLGLPRGQSRLQRARGCGGLRRAQGVDGNMAQPLPGKGTHTQFTATTKSTNE